MHYLYLGLNLFAISYPLAQSFEWRLQYAKKWKALFPAIVITGAFFIVWDIWFTEMEIWGFNPRYLTGIYMAKLPIEEWLFFIAVPFASVFIYECVWYFFPKIENKHWVRYASFTTAALLLLLALLNTSRAYTFCTFLFTSIFLGYVAFQFPNWLAKFWTGYLLHLIPFLLVNGVLTGSWIEEEVVWYNNAENLSIRIGTIPVEDTVYALLLLLMNVYFYELLIKKFGMMRTRLTQRSL